MASGQSCIFYLVENIIHPTLLSTAGAMGEDDEGTDDEGPIEVFGIHRLELKQGSKSGYVGVRPNPSKKRPWQAWLQDGGRRKTVGNYEHRQEAAVARAVAKAAGAHLLRSPRKQAARNSGAVPNPHRITSLVPRNSYPPSIMLSRMILDRKTFGGSGFDPSLAVRPQPDLLWRAADGPRRERTAERASAERIRL